ncbi:MAG: hypothetical protein M1827_002601 [Pycnora praestabilis]|nr:MAG: hypothetical protein M1827_002601 [Pycnora praestabilis]
MARIILSINAGSSSVKISVFKAEQKGQAPSQLAVAEVAGLTAPPATLNYDRGLEKIKGEKLEEKIESQEDAFKYILDLLVRDNGLPDIVEREHITHACHRVVHGGDYPDAQIINAETYHHLEKLTDLAPLHNAGALSIVKACHKELAKTRNIAYFDTSFHATMPEHIRTYPIDPKIAKQNKLRKYGFHGISYAFITRSVAEYLHKDQNETSIIALHLGSGASACAVKNGESLDNSMGLTPLAGLPGATRSGSVDPSLVFHYTHDAGRPSPSSTKEMHISTAEDILNKKSGWKSLTGTADFGKIASSDDSQCRLAFDIFVDRIVGYIGSYFVKLEGQVDALVFAGGIGEKSALLRTRVAGKCRSLGFAIDESKNFQPANEVVANIGKEESRARLLICRTDEQFEMARNCAANTKVWD